MIKTLRLIAKMAVKIAGKKTVSSRDYATDYDKSSATYDMWIEKMGQFTDRIIDFEEESRQGLHILDLACGSGYISLKARDKLHTPTITSVDISSGMLKQLSEKGGKGINIVHMDGNEFIKCDSRKYDKIFLAWALPYFNKKETIKLMADSLNPKGTIHIISNSKGTLSGIEKAFFHAMKNSPESLSRPMPISFNLPAGKNELSKWASCAGLEALKLGEDEANFKFESAELLLQWLENTGALAGCRSIFKDYEAARPMIIEGIQKNNRSSGHFTINHRFAYGIFQKM